jgi:hypothetical protein
MLHDSTLKSFNWDLASKIILMELEISESNEIVSAQFEGVEGFHFDDAICGCIIFDIEEINCEDYLDNDSKYINERINYSFNSVVDIVKNKKAKVWEISSSYGLCGYIIAKCFKIVREN